MWNLVDVRILVAVEGEPPLPGVPGVMPICGGGPLTVVIPIIEGLSAALIFNRRES